MYKKLENPYKGSVHYYASSGSDDKPTFGYVKKSVSDYDDTGKKVGSHDEIVFSQTGSTSISEYINSFNDSTDIKKIFERYQMGDTSVLMKSVSDYIDTVGCPTNLLDAQLMIKNGEQAFADLPAKVKEQYGNDPMKFIQACQDGSIKNVIQGLDQCLETSQEINVATNNKLNDSNKKIEELQAQIAELKGVKYE